MKAVVATSVALLTASFVTVSAAAELESGLQVGDSARRVQCQGLYGTQTPVNRCANLADDTVDVRL